MTRHLENALFLDSMVPAYVLAMFEGADPVVAPAVDPVAPAAVVPPPAAPATPKHFVMPSTSDPVELRRAAEAAVAASNTAQDRINELNAENTRRRANERELRTNHDALAAQVSASNQRVLRSEMRDALREAGAVGDGVLKAFVVDMADKVTIDPKTGEPTGIAAGLAEWKLAHPYFFKPEAPVVVPPVVVPPVVKPNATTKGATPAGGTEGGTPAVMPDLRGLDKKARNAAVDAYMASLRVK